MRTTLSLPGTVIALSMLLPTLAQAELSALSNDALSEVHGQAYFSVDRQFHPATGNNTSYTRINLGMDIEIQTNVETFEFGRYERTGEKAGSSDLLIKDFSLGYIYNDQYFRNNPDFPRQRKADGSEYRNGDIVPATITDPYLEFAYDESSKDIVGMRVGFGKAKGVMGGQIEALTGNINIDIIDNGAGMKAADSNGGFGDQLLVLLTPLLEGGSPLSTRAQLVDGNKTLSNGSPNPAYGSLDPIRSEYIGVADGQQFVLSDASFFTRWALKNLIGWTASSEIIVPGCSLIWCPGGDIMLVNQDCKVIGVNTCFDLGNYNSLPLGQIEKQGSKRFITGPSDGIFLSFQTKDLEWLKDVRKQNPSAADFMKATQGAFFNVPNGSTQVNLEQAIGGIPHQRTEYIDRGVGLF